MPVNDALGARMKENYENISKTKLLRRTPVAIRIDGKAFHTFTRGFKKPFDDILIKSMEETMLYLCKNIQGCVLGYHQSDEITLILTDYKRFNSDAWFDYEVQKLCSIAASMATMAFNKFFVEEVWNEDNSWRCGMTPQSVEIQQKHKEYMNTLSKKQLMLQDRLKDKDSVLQKLIPQPNTELPWNILKDEQFVYLQNVLEGKALFGQIKDIPPFSNPEEYTQIANDIKTQWLKKSYPQDMIFLYFKDFTKTGDYQSPLHNNSKFTLSTQYV